MKVRRIDMTEPAGKQQLAKYKAMVAPEGDIITPQGKKLSQAAFKAVLTPTQAVERICKEVREKGAASVVHYTELFDKVKLKPENLRVKEQDIIDAHGVASGDYLDCVRRIRYNIDSFQSGLLHRDAELRVSGQHELHVRYRPMKRIGVYCPGGAAAYPSTLLMTVCPAKAAGVEEIVVCMPPKDTGANNKDMLALCHELGVKEVYRIGGAQAIAAMAYGLPGVMPPVNMIVGPGNQFVALAKKHVYGHCAIDCIAGPSEVVVAADDSAHPNYVALDLIAQAEHAPGIPILVTWYEPLINEVVAALEKRLAKLSRSDLARECIEKQGAFILAKDKAHAIEVVNELAPEHLHIQTRDPDAFADEIDNAGAIFLGPFTPVAIGDYAAGPSHVLPTGGTSKFSSGLNANDFRKRTSVLRFTRNGMKDIAEDVIFMAKKEGLTAHAASIEQRAADNGPAARPKPKPDKPAPPSPLKGKST
jgi:histidinol dehydrogenase